MFAIEEKLHILQEAQELNAAVCAAICIDT